MFILYVIDNLCFNENTWMLGEWLKTVAFLYGFSCFLVM